MIQRLKIQNYALIEHLEIELDKGLTIITGETGAGKSIILGALGLLGGERADSRIIADKSKKTVIEALFTELPSDLEDFFLSQGLEWNDEEILIRRELSATGRSRTFVNDSPVTLAVVSEIMGRLLDIHSQHSNILLGESDAQLSILDQYAGVSEKLESYRESFRQYVSLRHKIKKLKEKAEKNKAESDFILFQLEQLDKIKPKQGELAKIEQEYELLSEADRIQDDLREVSFLMDGDERSVLSSLNKVGRILSGNYLNVIDKNNKDNLHKRVDQTLIELKDLSHIIANYLEEFDSDPERLEKLSARMHLLYDTIRRFKVKDENELVLLHKELRSKADSLTTDDEDISSMQAEGKKLIKVIKDKAEELSEERRKGADRLASEILEIARPLGLPNLRFEIKVTPGKLTSDGQDTVSFECSFNKSHPMQEMQKVASGGEMARVILSIKAIMARRMNMPTIIFDEIDTGVSGEIADRMGNMMRQIGESSQVISITHLPQVATKGMAHFKVYKEDDNEKTRSHMKKLSEDERVNEIAGMLSGKKVNESAILNAQELLKEASEKKS